MRRICDMDMGFLEKKLYKLFKNQYGRTDGELLSKLFKRFLDDCVLLWNKSEQQLTDFHAPTPQQPPSKETLYYEMQNGKITVFGHPT